MARGGINRALPLVLFAAGIQLAIAGLAGGVSHLFSKAIAVSPTQLLAAAFAAIAAALLARRGRVSDIRVAPLVWTFGLAWVFASDWMSHDFVLFDGPALRGEILLTALICAAIFRHLTVDIWPQAAILSALLLFVVFCVVTSLSPLWADDHAAVFYRLQLLKENFPFIPHYNPLWNAGMDARDYFATGILNMFALAAPLLYAFELPDVYTLATGMLLFGFLPAMVYLAARESGLDRQGAAISAILALTSSALWYRWSLKYGAMGFITSACLFPYCAIVLVRLIAGERRLGLLDTVVLAVALSLMLCWSLTAIACFPLIAAGVAALPKLSRLKNFWLLCALVAIVNLPWMAVFVTVSDVARFSQLKAPSEAGRPEQSESAAAAGALESHHHGAVSSRAVKGKGKEITAKQILTTLRQFAVKANPVLVFIALPGVFAVFSGYRRKLVAALLLWLAFLGLVVSCVKPQLELERMLLLGLLLSAIPAGGLCAEIFKQVSGGSVARVLQALLAGFVLAGVAASGSFVSNHSLERYTVTGPVVTGLAQAIAAGGGEGRTVFTAFVLHELENGHLAPLAYYSGKPLVASSPIHNLWWYTDVIPDEFRRRGEAGIEQWLDLVNATAVVAHEPGWKHYFDIRPETYRRLWSGGRFVLYSRGVNAAGYFLSGAGEVLQQDTAGLRLRVDSEEAVIKFRYYPFLASSSTSSPAEGSCALGPKPVGEGTVFIELTGCKPGQEIEIRSVSAPARLRQSWGRQP